MDRITLRGLRAYGRHGVDPGERERTQPFDIDVTMTLDLRAAQRSDDLDRSIDYAALAGALRSCVETTSFALLEALAGALLEIVCADARVRRARIAVGKPGILAGATPSVVLRRKNPHYRRVSS
ncbi:MAG: dihydroneopterin aldolase [Vulcanimicrobiaceae bacterium]